MLPEPFIRKLVPFVTFIPICPEFEIGLGIPRDPIRVVLKNTRHHLLQPDSGRDVTSAMNKFSKEYLTSLSQVDGFILKGRSPSCGIKDVRIYPGIDQSGAVGKGSGLFAEAVLERFADLPVEDEGRLSNFNIREHFLTRLFALAAWRAADKVRSMKNLVAFQAANKLLLMAYNQKEMRILGRIVANHEKKEIGKMFNEYGRHFRLALSVKPRHQSHINVLMHALGYFSDKLTKSEKRHFLGLLEKYRDGKTPLSVPISLTQSWIARFDETYLAEQTFFEPYPEALVEITDSGKGRDT
jgi:uncharacterized protein YbgA (DUF1722 family)/uncharacterized protein YbbK (DUF523 family)